MVDLLGLFVELPFELGLLEGALAAVAELFAEFAKPLAEPVSILSEHLAPRPVRPASAAAAGYLALGVAVGIGSSLPFPLRLLPRSYLFPGSSVLLAPLATGLAMHYFGKWRRQQGGQPSRLATYWGGGLFGFGAALARFLMIGR
jgi:hypothetical protein